MIIKNARVYGENGKFEERDIYIDGEKLVEKAPVGDDCEIDAQGLLVIPGLIDVHFHGCVGYDFCDGTHEAIEKMAEYQISNGVTTICPATMTLSEEALTTICKAAGTYEGKKGAELIGINMEGPFISMEKKGAQNPAYIKAPDVDMFHRLNEAAKGMVKLVALAPEEVGAKDFIDQLKNEVNISIAHTSANYDTALDAFQRGAAQVTHLYNAMPAYTHRAPGVIGAATDSSCMVELICDGVHVHPAVIRNTFRMFGNERIIFVSDSMMATGMEDGEYSLGGQAVKVRGNLATLVVDGAIAGSATNLFHCMKYAVNQAEISLEDAVKCCTENPAKSIGIFGQYGSIRPGKYADLVILDAELNIKKVMKKGKSLNEKSI